MRRFVICSLLYGGEEFGWLHQRCLKSIAAALPAQDMEWRIGLNDMTAASTHMLLADLQQTLGERIRLFSGENVGKYPRMREMLADTTRKFVMWFDDDSFLRPELAVPGAAAWWLDRIVELQYKTPGILGAIYRRRWTPARLEWFKAQPGYCGREMDQQFEKFVTGGWWVAPRTWLQKLNWPPAELHHNGGDCLLGSLTLQNGGALISFRHGVAINADADGRESKARRRGLNTKPLGD